MCACNNITLIFTCPSSWCVHFSALPLAAVQESFEGHPGFQLPTDGYVLDLNRPPPEPEKFQFCIETLRRNLKKPKSACLNLYTFHTFAPTCFCKFLTWYCHGFVPSKTRSFSFLMVVCNAFILTFLVHLQHLHYQNNYNAWFFFSPFIFYQLLSNGLQEGELWATSSL